MNLLLVAHKHTSPGATKKPLFLETLTPEKDTNWKPTPQINTLGKTEHNARKAKKWFLNIRTRDKGYRQ